MLMLLMVKGGDVGFMKIPMVFYGPCFAFLFIQNLVLATCAYRKVVESLNEVMLPKREVNQFEEFACWSRFSFQIQNYPHISYIPIYDLVFVFS